MTKGIRATKGTPELQARPAVRVAKACKDLKVRKGHKEFKDQRDRKVHRGIPGRAEAGSRSWLSARPETAAVSFPR